MTMVKSSTDGGRDGYEVIVPKVVTAVLIVKIIVVVIFSRYVNR